MRSGFIRLRMYSTTAVMLTAAALLFIQPHTYGASAAAPQGKGGTIKPVPTPTPPPKKATPRKVTAAPRVTTKPNLNARPKVDAAATERTYWETIRNSTDVEDFRAYLKKYPAGQFTDLAKNRVRALEAAKPRPSPTPAPTPAPSVDRPVGSTEASGGERNLSLTATLNWLEEKLETYAKKQDTDDTKVKVTQMNECAIVVRDHLNISGAPYRDITVPLADLDATYRVSPMGSLSSVWLKTTNQNKRIIVKKLADNTTSPDTDFYLFFDDPDMADRVGKAFVHAIKLCKQKEPF